MSTPDKCPHCGAPKIGSYYTCCTHENDRFPGPICRERAAHAETKKQYMELIMAVARKFDGETRHQTALRYINHAEDLAREAGKADAAMNRLDAEAKEGR